MRKYQLRVRKWVLACFGLQTANFLPERNLRFLEESLELVQSLGMTKAEVMNMVNYTYRRPAGEPAQEVGGVLITLAALASSANLNMNKCGMVELERVEANVSKIRAKHNLKPSDIRKA